MRDRGDQRRVFWLMVLGFPVTGWRRWLLALGTWGPWLGFLSWLLLLNLATGGRGGDPVEGAARLLPFGTTVLVVVWGLAPVVGVVASEWVPARGGAFDESGFRGSTRLLLRLTSHPAVAAVAVLFPWGPPAWLGPLVVSCLGVCLATVVAHTVRARRDVRPAEVALPRRR